MRAEWKRTESFTPQQGRKLLWFHSGDVFVAQRFGDKYLSLQPGEAVLMGAPELWDYVAVPEPFKGLIWIEVEGKMYTVDELEIEHPRVYRDLIEMMHSKNNVKWEAEP